jgi:CRP/FNR family transcriptional regulator
MDILSAIKSINFFNTLNHDQINYLINISSISSFSKDTIIYFESDVNYSLQFLISGVVKVYKIDKFNNEIFLYHIHKGKMISELSSIDSESIYCFSNASFIEKGVILSVDFNKFKNYFIDSGILASEFIKEILEKSRLLQCIINRELVFDATTKVAHMLYTDLEMFNNLKKTEIAFMLHIQPETLSRVLKRFTRELIIEVQDKKNIIINDEKLSSIFKGIGL